MAAYTACVAGAALIGDIDNSMVPSTEQAWSNPHADIRTFVRRRVRDHTDVEDVVQRVFLQAHRALPTVTTHGIGIQDVDQGPLAPVSPATHSTGATRRWCADDDPGCVPRPTEESG